MHDAQSYILARGFSAEGLDAASPAREITRKNARIDLISHTQLLMVAVASAEFADYVAYEIFGVAEEHEGLVEVIQRVVDAGEAGGHAALDDHDGARFVHVQDGHAEDGAGGVGASGGSGDS